MSEPSPPSLTDGQAGYPPAELDNFWLTLAAFERLVPHLSIRRFKIK
ncbi:MULTISPECIES: hypothetical protein [Paraburkholderia]|nr:hypothetical protein [Paraburkholderia podalyriae]